MSTYLERYLNGEYEQVWAELMALGGQIRQEPLYTDALAVAQETMTRVKQNIQTLVVRLKELNYHFGWPDEVYVPPEKEQLERITQIEQEVGLFPLSLRVFYEVVGSVNFMGRHPVLSNYNSDFPGEEENWIAEQENCINDYTEPLVVYRPPEELYELYYPHHFREDEDVKDVRAVFLTPDIIMKSGYSGNLPDEIWIPNPAIDAIIKYDIHYTNRKNQTFVEYLRCSLQWGGFPGLADTENPPTEELEFLTKDLLPI